MNIKSALATCALMLVAYSLSVVAVPQDAPQFRGTVAGVAVHTLVRDGQRPVTNLNANELTLTDNGVPQEISAVGATTVPLDVSLVVAERLSARYQSRESFRPEVLEVSRLLRDVDRLRVVMFGDEVSEIVSLTAPPVVDEFPPVQSRCSAFYDALATVLIPSTEPGRQHVVVVLTMGEGGSIVGRRAIVEIAQRSDARVHVLLRKGEWVRASGVPARRGACTPFGEDWEQYQARLRAIAPLSFRQQVDAKWDDVRQNLVQLAKMTGGGEIRSSLFTGSMAGPVRSVLDETRSGYMLYYVPRGVAEEGWHQIAVTVTRPGKYEIRARPGYAR